MVDLGHWPHELGFADGPKAELFETTGLSKGDEGWRDTLIELAHSRRGEQPDYWVDKLARRLVSLSPCGAVPIITDMRYYNELVWAAGNEFVTVRVDATHLHRMAVLHSRGEDPFFSESKHPSECELDESGFDFRFWNDHDSPFVLPHYAGRVIEMLLGQVIRELAS